MRCRAEPPGGSAHKGILAEKGISHCIHECYATASRGGWAVISSTLQISTACGGCDIEFYRSERYSN